MAKQWSPVLAAAVLVLSHVVAGDAVIVKEKDVNLEGDSEVDSVEDRTKRACDCEQKNNPSGSLLTITRDYTARERQMIQETRPAVKSPPRIVAKGLLDDLLPPVLLNLRVGKKA